MTLDQDPSMGETPSLDVQTPSTGSTGLTDATGNSLGGTSTLGDGGLGGSSLGGSTGLGSDPSTYGQSSVGGDDGGAGIGQTARQMAEGVAAVAGDVSTRIPEVAQTTRGAFEEANRMVHRGSDQTLQLVGALSIGFAVGLLVGGAHRLLVILSLIPAGLIGATIVERMESGDVWTDVLDSDAVVQGG